MCHLCHVARTLPVLFNQSRQFLPGRNSVLMKMVAAKYSEALVSLYLPIRWKM